MFQCLGVNKCGKELFLFRKRASHRVLTDFMQVRVSSLNMHKMKNKIAPVISRVEETVIKRSLSQEK